MVRGQIKMLECWGKLRPVVVLRVNVELGVAVVAVGTGSPSKYASEETVLDPSRPEHRHLRSLSKPTYFYTDSFRHVRLSALRDPRFPSTASTRVLISIERLLPTLPPDPMEEAIDRPEAVERPPSPAAKPSSSRPPAPLLDAIEAADDDGSG
jgi:hypothetical protein